MTEQTSKTKVTLQIESYDGDSSGETFVGFLDVAGLQYDVERGTLEEVKSSGAELAENLGVKIESVEID